MSLYHLTPEEFLPSILIQGLRINTGNAGIFVDYERKSVIDNYTEKYDMQPVFLTVNIDLIIKHQIGERIIKRDRYYCLSVDMEYFDVEPEYEYLNNRWNLYYKSYQAMKENIRTEPTLGTTFICRHNIPVNKIINVKKIIL